MYEFLSKKDKQPEAETVDVLAHKKSIREAQAEAHAVNVLAHIQAHKDAGDTEAVKKHMAAPKHKAIVDAAAKAAKETVPNEDVHGK